MVKGIFGDNFFKKKLVTFGGFKKKLKKKVKLF